MCGRSGILGRGKDLLDSVISVGWGFNGVEGVY